MDTTELHTYLERLCNLLRVEARTQGAVVGGLLPVQLEALHYLSRCNRYSDNVQAVSEFLGQTKGSVSQTIKILENKGLVKKNTHKLDRRLVHLKPTAKGRRVLTKILPANFLTDAMKSLSETNQNHLIEGLRELLSASQRANSMKSFAACRTCRYHQESGGSFKCGLTGEKLSEADRELICREHDYPPIEKLVSDN